MARAGCALYHITSSPHTLGPNILNHCGLRDPVRSPCCPVCPHSGDRAPLGVPEPLPCPGHGAEQPGSGLCQRVLEQVQSAHSSVAVPTPLLARLPLKMLGRPTGLWGINAARRGGSGSRELQGGALLRSEIGQAVCSRRASQKEAAWGLLWSLFCRCFTKLEAPEPASMDPSATPQTDVPAVGSVTAVTLGIGL